MEALLMVVTSLKLCVMLVLKEPRSIIVSKIP